MVDIRGPIDAPAIIFVHGAGISRKLWLPQMDSLAETYRTLAPDLPGHDGKRTRGSQC
ncbi:alpha/beta fold hydrolase [Haloferax sp. YSMS24]|uniref:alpha/beta fold hydrolase n=1 Tax=Haloferax sp. YSMS24 TaxID=3388425 RepID=UPI00398CC850